MKKLFVLFTAVLALTAVSCEPEDVNEVDGKAKELKALDSSKSTWNTDKRVFELTFSGEKTTLSTTLIAFDAELPGGKYALVKEASAGIGDAVLEKTLLNNAAVKSGSVSVGKSGKKYNFTIALTGEDGKEKTFTWAGDINWPADPAPKQTLSVVLSAQSNLPTAMNPNGTYSVTMNLANAGVSAEYEGWNLVWKGEGGYLALDLYSENGYLAEGIYKPCAEGGKINPGEFGIGYDTTITYQDWSTGQPVDATYEAKDWGTCWWTVKDGKNTADHKILDGVVVVRKVDAGWQISWGKEYPTEYLFEGAIEALTEPEKTDDPEAGPVLNITSGLTYTMEDQTATNTAADGSALSGVTLWRVTVSQGAAVVANFDFVVEAGQASVAGTYTVMSYPDAAGKAGNGWGFPAYGMLGGCYYVVDGKYYYIPNDATVTATENSNGTLKIEFAGAVQKDDYSDGGQGSVLLDNIAKA